MPATLTQNQVDRFNRDGYLVAEDAVTPDQLFQLRAEIEAWVAESRDHVDGPASDITSK